MEWGLKRPTAQAQAETSNDAMQAKISKHQEKEK